MCRIAILLLVTRVHEHRSGKEQYVSTKGIYPTNKTKQIRHFNSNSPHLTFANRFAKEQGAWTFEELPE